MYTCVSLRKPAWCTPLVLHNTRMFPKYVTIYIETHVYLLNMRLLSLKPVCFYYRHQKKKFLEVWVVWVVMQLTPSILTNFSSTLSLHKGINRGKEVHERGLEILHCYARGIGTLFPPPFPYIFNSLCCRYWRMNSLEK